MGLEGWSPWIAMDGVLGVGLAMQPAGSLATANGLLVARCSGPRPAQEHAGLCQFVATLQYVASWQGVKRSLTERGFLGPAMGCARLASLSSQPRPPSFLPHRQCYMYNFPHANNHRPSQSTDHSSSQAALGGGHGWNNNRNGRGFDSPPAKQNS